MDWYIKMTPERKWAGERTMCGGLWKLTGCMIRNQGIEGAHQERYQGKLTDISAAYITLWAYDDSGNFILIKIFSYF